MTPFDSVVPRTSFPRLTITLKLELEVSTLFRCVTVKFTRGQALLLADVNSSAMSPSDRNLQATI